MSDILGLAKARTCTCAQCENGRFIKRLVALLPEAEANELNDWYYALLDNTSDKEMDFYWINQKLEDLQKSVAEFAQKRRSARIAL